jgi:hypothetical protein
MYSIMRLASFKSLLFGVCTLFMAGAFLGCENPFDPISKSDKIQGLTYIDFTAAWERWDSDPQGDGLLVTLSYSNEFGESLAFHDKPHKVIIEFWTQKNKNEGVEGSSAYIVKDQLFFSKTITFSNSDDDIRIPVEAYYQALQAAAPENNTGFVQVRVFPPEQDPRTELVVAQSDVEFYVDETGEDIPNI